MSFITDDPFRAALLALVLLLAIVWLARRLGAAADGTAVRSWQVFLIGLWALAVLVATGLTYYVDAWMVCSTTTVESTSHTIVEETDVDVVSETDEMRDSFTEKTTTNPDTSETTRECEGIGVAMIAVLLLPGLVFLLPSVSNLDVAGLFKLTFRELKKSVDEQKKKIDDVATDVAEIRIAQETLVQIGLNLHIYQNAGDVVQRGLRQERAGETISLEQFEQLTTLEGDD